MGNINTHLTLENDFCTYLVGRHGKMEDTLGIMWALQFNEYLFNKLFPFFNIFLNYLFHPSKYSLDKKLGV